MANLVLVVEGKRLIVKGEWINRWEALSNVVSEMGARELNWTLNSTTEMQQWIKLNKMMDAGYSQFNPRINRLHDVDLIDLTKVWRVVDNMIPLNDSWLTYVLIDDSLPILEKRKWYMRLGRYVRSNRIRLPYNIPREEPTGIHFNLHLENDLAYGSEILRDFDSYPPAIRDAIINLPSYNLATGVIHTGWVYSNSSSYYVNEWERKYLEEVVWDAIRWIDMIDMDAPGLLVSFYTEVSARFINVQIEDIVEGTGEPELHDVVLGLIEGVDSPFWRATEDAMIASERKIEKSSIIPFLAGVRLNVFLEPQAVLVERHGPNRPTIIKVPKPALYMKRVCELYRRIQPDEMLDELTSRFTFPSVGLQDGSAINPLGGINVMLNHIAIDTRLYIDPKVGQYTYYELHPENYDAALRKIASTLGVELLEIIVEGALDMIDRMQSYPEDAGQSARLSVMAAAGVEVLETETGYDFVRWPVITLPGEV